MLLKLTSSPKIDSVLGAKVTLTACSHHSRKVHDIGHSLQSQ